jgi:ribosomal protein S18 acetylase RimI-like enzyme
MIYRNMQISDYASVIALWRGCDGVSLRDADSSQGIERYLQRNPGLSFVALEGTDIVGTIMAGHDGKRGYIQHLAVANVARGQGIASSLVELCLQALKLQGVEKSHVHVLGDNEPGRKFWSGRGWFHRAEIVMYSFINGENKNA